MVNLPVIWDALMLNDMKGLFEAAIQIYRIN